MAASDSSPDVDIPSSILIVGSGVFGLSTAYALCKNSLFDKTSITLVEQSPFPNPLGSSIDSSRIVRADYADPAYAALALKAQDHWRGHWGDDGRYQENGLILTAEPDAAAYVDESFVQVRELFAKHGVTTTKDGRPALELLSSPEDITRVAGGTDGCSGTRGYINRMSGWADAEASMLYLHSLVTSLNRVRFITATVTRLAISSTTPPTILGVHTTASPSPLTASLTILATGAWTPALLDLRGIARCTGQILTYLPIAPATEAALKRRPTLLNLSTGMFALPPHRGMLKLARHGHGYGNPTTIPHPELPAASGERITVSLPAAPPPTHLPPEAIEACRSFLKDLFPAPHAEACGKDGAAADGMEEEGEASEREKKSERSPLYPFARGRICHYLDTRAGDFLVTYHPAYARRSLLVAAGGNGHAFKFLPVIGEKVVEILLRRGEEAAAADGAGEEGLLARKWAWPRERLDEDRWEGDGSRGGRKGMILAEELEKRRGG